MWGVNRALLPTIDGPSKIYLNLYMKQKALHLFANAPLNVDMKKISVIIVYAVKKVLKMKFGSLKDKNADII